MSKRAIIWCAVSTVVQANEEEKFSMPQQEADAKRVAAELGYTVVDIMRVPGHSRDYKSLEKLAEDAKKRDIDAFYRLIDHLEAADFDLFICRDANRFARRASLLHYIVESIMDCDAKIYSLADGWVDRSNANIWAAFKGYETNQQMSWLRDSKAKGYAKRVERGLLVSPKVPPFLRVIRDPETGKEQYVEINEELRRLYDDIATLILQGVAWYDMEAALYEKGHVNPKTGKAWPVGRVADFVFNPLWWGHTAMNHRAKDDKDTRNRKAWIWDETIEPPDEFIVARNTIPAVWSGQLAKDIQAELYRRAEIGKRRGLQGHSGRFTGLLVCQECGYRLTFVRKRRARGVSYFTGWRCMTYYSRRRKSLGKLCENKYQMADSRVQTYIHDAILAAADGKEPGPFSVMTTNRADADRAIAQAERELDGATQSIQSLIRQQGNAAEAAQAFYQAEIDTHAEHIKALKQHIKALQVEAVREERDSKRQRDALKTIVEHIDEFWTWPTLKINQHLRAALGKNRFVVYQREITGITDKT